MCLPSQLTHFPPMLNIAHHSKKYTSTQYKASFELNAILNIRTMSMVQCFFQSCFKVQDDSADAGTYGIIEEFHEPASPQILPLNREETPIHMMETSPHDIVPPPPLLMSEEIDDTNDTTEDNLSTPLTGSRTYSQRGFGFMVHEILQGIESTFSNSSFDLQQQSPSEYEKIDCIKKEFSNVEASPLRTATVYKSLNDIPSIALDEVVMPGSKLQKQMSLRLQGKGILSEAEVDECVICMEAFDDSNPRMPTICGCGENKTFFHLPCLYQWVEKSRECPSCRQELTWREF